MNRFPYHTFLLGLYPVVALLAHNITQIRISDALPSMLIVLLAAALLLALLRLLLKDWQKAGLIASILLAGFFLYGHIYNFLQANPIFGFSLGRHRLLAPVWLALLAAGVVWAYRRRRSVELLTQALNMVAIVALIFPLVQIGSYQAHALQAARAAPAPATQGYTRPDPAPDIYYIILDSYGREDVLEKSYGTDITPFLDELRRLGFFVGDCSQSNYAQTVLSLASSLNYSYLEELGIDTETGGEDRSLAVERLRHSELRRVLEDLGYSTVALDSGFYQTQIQDADVFYSFKHDTAGGINGFEVMLLETSASLMLTDMKALLPNAMVPDVSYPHKLQRQMVLYALDKLADLPRVPGPKLVLAHIVSPHEPFVFGPDGEEVLVSEDALGEVYAAGYRDQVAYLNKRLVPLLETLIRDSETPPVIILQGDHGVGRGSPRDRMKILNAYYLPGEGRQALYPSISPVNSFRVVLNEYFGAELPLLEDRANYSSYQEPYDFRLMEETCP